MLNSSSKNHSPSLNNVEFEEGDSRRDLKGSKQKSQNQNVFVDIDLNSVLTKVDKQLGKGIGKP